MHTACITYHYLSLHLNITTFEFTEENEARLNMLHDNSVVMAVLSIILFV